MKTLDFKKIYLISLPLIVIFLLVLKASASVSAVVLTTWLFLWTISFYKRYGFQFSDIPLLIILLGTFSFGKAFSLIGIPLPMGNISFFITEFMLVASLIILLLKGQFLWREWSFPFPRGLAAVFLIYLLLGAIYLLYGVKGHGFSALRDIVFCVYLLFLIITLHLLAKSKKIKNIIPFLIPAIILVLLTGFILFFTYFPGSSFKVFLREIKMTNLGLYYGLILFFGLSFFAVSSRRQKYLMGIVSFLALLFIVLAEVRASWAGLLVSFILLAFLLKREIKIFLLIFILVVISVVIIDYFDLSVQKNKLESIGRQVKSVLKYKAPTMPAANIKWRLGIWTQTIDEIRQNPIFGWGYGTQIDYKIWKKRLSWLKAQGASTGIVPPHNHLLAITYKMGLLGLALFLFINARIFFYGLFYLKRCQSDFHRRFLIASLVSLVYWHGMAFFFDILESPPTGIFLWIILGSILGVVHADLRNGQDRSLQ